MLTDQSEKRACLGIMGDQFRAPLKTLKQHNTVAWKGFREGWSSIIGHTEKTIYFHFLSNSMGYDHWWQFSFRFWTNWNYIWFKIERKTVTTTIYHSIWKEMEILFSQCTHLCLSDNRDVIFSGLRNGPDLKREREIFLHQKRRNVKKTTKKNSLLCYPRKIWHTHPSLKDFFFLWKFVNLREF